jgi:hypothetical protein
VKIRSRARLLPVAVVGLVTSLAGRPAGAQTAESHAASGPGATTPAVDSTKDPVFKLKSTFGANLERSDARKLLGEMQQLTQQALATSRSAEKASSVAEVKNAAGKVIQMVWGTATARGEGNTAELTVPGWKERWQVTGAEWSPSYAKRLGTAQPKITDPRQLGVMGRGRAVRGRLTKIIYDSTAAAPVRESAKQVYASINDVIGWTYIGEGLKGNEMQPRISLTYMWDAPPEFWQSDADTGWLDAVFAQASNILKTDYGTDVGEARKHAAGMSELLQRVLNGVDADKNGTIEPKMMEGGLNAAVRAAGKDGI